MKNLSEQQVNEASAEYESMIQYGTQLAEREMEDGGWAEMLNEGELLVEDSVKKAQAALLLNNAKSWLYGMHESTRSMMVGGFQDYLFPVIRAAFVENPVYDLVSVQPMTKRVGQIFWLNYIYGSTKGSITKGDHMFDVGTGWHGATGYTDEVVDLEDQPATNGVANATTAGQTSYFPVRPGTFQFTIDDTVDYVIRDDGNGGLVKVSGGALTISSGSVNYDTGAWTVTMSGVLPTDAGVVATYAFDGEENSNIPLIDFEISSSAVAARRRAVQIRYNEEKQQDFGAEFGMDAASIIINGATQNLITETAGEVVRDLWDMAGTPSLSFNVNQSAAPEQGYSKTEHLRDIRFQLNQASNGIYDATQRAEGTFIVVDMNGATTLETMGRPIFEPVAGRTTGRQGLVKIGVLDGKYDVYRYKQLASLPGAAAFGNMLMGFKGPDFWDAGYVWSPYQSLYSH